MTKLVLDFKDADGWVKTKYVLGVRTESKSHRLWKAMKARCSPRIKAVRSTYAECEMSAEFVDFQVFAGWCQEQVGYGLQGTALDKDLLIKGNKVYGPEVCVFVPNELNVLLNKHKATRGEFPIGVHQHNQGYGYVAQCNVAGERVYLGDCMTPH